MKRYTVGVAALVMALVAGDALAQSQETGIAEIHSWTKVGRKTCMSDHFHDGSGSGASRVLAERAAVRAWVEFTAWEYGDSWGRYNMAVSKKATCSRESEGWHCAVEARPCRPF